MVGHRPSLDGGASLVAGTDKPLLDQMQVTAVVLGDTVLPLEEC
jgi:hypothetical protein